MIISNESIYAFSLAAALLALAPGPDNLFVLTQSALHGKKSGIVITLGLCTGLLFHTLAVVLGLAALLNTYPVLFIVLKLIGAAYLCFLAWQLFQAGNKFQRAQPLLSPLALYRRGILMNITNPKVSLFFLAFLPQFTTSDQTTLSMQLFFLGMVFILISLMMFCAIAIMAGSIQRQLESKPHIQRYINRATSLVLFCVALKLLFINDMF